MGWDIKRFVDKEDVIEDLKCSICTEVLEKPVQTPCDHLFCDECIKQWLHQGQQTCPVDREQLTPDALKPASRITRQLLDKLHIHCKHYAEGCCLMSKLENMPQLIEHELNLCEVVKKDQVREIRSQFKEEADELKKKISELEETLSLKASLHLIAQDDITEREKEIIHLKKIIEDNDRRNMRTCLMMKHEMMVQDTAEEGTMLATRGLSVHPNHLALTTGQCELDTTNNDIVKGKYLQYLEF